MPQRRHVPAVVLMAQCSHNPDSRRASRRVKPNPAETRPVDHNGPGAVLREPPLAEHSSEASWRNARQCRN